MAKRLSADSIFTPQQDFYCLSRHLDNASVSNLHCHEFYEVEIVTSGTCIDEINEKSYVLNRGDFIFLQPENCHYIQGFDGSEADIVNLAVSAELMQEILTFLETPDIPSVAWPITGHLPQTLISKLTDHMRDLLLPSRQIERDRSTIKQWMTTCLLCSGFSQAPKTAVIPPFWFQHLLDKLKTPEGFSGGVEYLKTHTDRSYPHICRCFQKYLQKTPVQWINEQRLVYSAHLLLHTNQSILEISLECGFHNLSHFNHLFKEFYGVSPTALRSLV